MNLNNKRWEKFIFSDIFVIKNGFFNKKPESSGQGDIPFLGAVDSNNGVTEYYTFDEIEASSKTGALPNEMIERKIFPSNAVCVTNNGSVGYAYYQRKKFTCSHDVNALYLKDTEFNEYTGLFVATVIMHDRYRWDYGRKWRPTRMCNSEIKLPIKQDKVGAPVIEKKQLYSQEGYIPDWGYMEEYMKKLKSNRVSTSKKKQNQSTNSEEWEQFRLTDIFAISRGNGFSRNYLEDGNENGVNFVSRQSYHNGINSIVEPLDKVVAFKSGSITVALGGEYLGSSFVQLKPFYTGAHMAVLQAKDKNMTLYSKLFICTLIRFEAKTKYCAFGRELDTHIDKEFSIKLPVKKDENGNKIIQENALSEKMFVPDWEWIDHFMSLLPYSEKIESEQGNV